MLKLRRSKKAYRLGSLFFPAVVVVAAFLVPAVHATTTSYTGAGSTAFTVPANVTSIQVTLTGAAGGVGGNDGVNLGGSGGPAGRVTGTLAVTPGDTLTFGRGGSGGNGTSGASNGGGGLGGSNAGGRVSSGAGGAAGGKGSSGGGGGGGGSALITRSGVTIAEAGGAGGGGGAGNTSPDQAGLNGNTTASYNGLSYPGGAGTSRGSADDGGGGGGGGTGKRGGAGGGLRTAGDTDSGGNGGSAGENDTTGLTSASSSYVTVSAGVDASISITYTAVPSAPVISGTSTDTSVALTWSAPASGPSITDYLVQYRAAGGTVWSTFNDGVRSATGATVTGLNQSSSYEFQVAAVNADGTGAYSSAITVATKKNFYLSLSAGSSSYTLLGSAAAVDSSLTITDETSGSISAAKVQISAGFQTGDTLALPSGPGYSGITGSYNPTNGILTLAGSGNATAYQAALRAVTFATTSTATGTRSIDVALGDAVVYDGHFYEVVNSSVTWPNARSGALAKSLFGIPGYLVNITSAAENQFILSKVSTTAWIGASDSGAEGTWKWMDGPEAGTTFWIGTGTGSAQGGQYANWNTNEPNDSAGAEDYASIYSGVGASDGKWNDYGGSGPYIVEYGNPDAVISFSGTKTLSVTQAPQAITFNTLPTKTYGDAAFTLSATGGASGNPVTYTSSNPGVATVSSNTVAIVGAGTTTITANQLGNANYVTAAPVSQTLTVNKAAQTIVFGTLSAVNYSANGKVNLTASGGGSTSPVTYTSSNPNVASVAGSTATIRGVGTTTITASQLGDNNYEDAFDVSRTLTVNSVYSPVYGTTDSQNFNGADTNSTPRFANGWTASEPGDMTGTYPDGYRSDGAGDVFASIGGYTTTQPKARLTYKFTPGSSDRLVFTWKQNVETSGPDFPAVDRFGWEFRSGTNALFSLKMAQFVDSNGNGTWDPATNSIPAEPLAVAANDQPGGYTDTNGVSLYVTNKVVVVGFASDGTRLTTADQPNFAVIDRDSWYELRVIVDLREDRWWAQIKSGSGYMNLMGDAGAPLPAGTTSLDQVAALWELNNTRRDSGFLYQEGGSNQMLFDDLSIEGRKIVHLGLATPSGAIYSGSAQGATATDESSGTAQIDYSILYSGVTNTTVPVNAGTYIATAGINTNTTPYFAVVGTNAARLYTNSASLTLQYVIERKSVTITGVGVADKIFNGNTSATITGTPVIDGKVTGDDVSVAGGTANFTTADAGAVKLATISGYNLTGTAAPNYLLTGMPISASAEISKKTLTVTAQVKTKVFGNSDPALTYNSSGLVGSDALSGSLERVTGENVGSYAIQQGSLDAGSNYNLNYTGANFTITAAPLPLVTFTPPASLVYDGSAKSHTASASGVGSFAYLYTGSSPSFSATNAPTDAGNYRLVVTSADPNYSGSATNDFVIRKALPGVTWTNPAAITYGTALSSAQLNATSPVAGTFTYSPTNGAVLNAGTNTLTAVFSATDSNNYVSPSTNTVILVVTKASQTITFPPLANGIVGGSLTLTATSDSGLAVGYTSSDTHVATVTGTTLNYVGVGLVTITASQAGDNNYEPASDKSQTFSVLTPDTPWDTWADAYGLTSRTQNLDPDGDGFNNALEFAFGTDPTVRNSEVFTAVTSGSNYVVTFKKRKLASDATYEFRSSSNLSQAFSAGTLLTAGPTTSVNADYEQTSVSIPLSGTRGFIRGQASVLVSPSR